MRFNLKLVLFVVVPVVAILAAVWASDWSHDLEVMAAFWLPSLPLYVVAYRKLIRS